jgi:hypothetical protein
MGCDPAASIEPVTDRHRAVQGSRAAADAAAACALPQHPAPEGAWTVELAAGEQGAALCVAG